MHLRRVADARSAASDPQQCWGRVLHQHNAAAHRARDTVELLRCETAQFISPDK